MVKVVFYSESCTNIQRARQVFGEMRAMGAHAVVIAVYEQDLLRWKADMIRLFAAAREAGLRMYASLARYGGVFLGLLTVPSPFAYEQPETRGVSRVHP